MMLKLMAIVWWGGGLLIFSLVALNGGSSAWVGIVLCALLLVLSLVDIKWGWGHSKDPNDWSV